ncbi:MAG: cation:proton antiporter [Streptosporangiaceae bacterium]
MSAAVPVAPIAAHDVMTLLLQLGLLLLGALLLGRLAMRYGMPAIVGELLVGITLGPSILGHIAPDFADWLLPKNPAQFHLLDSVAQVGLLLLVGLTGIHMDLGLVRKRAKAATRISITGLVIPLGLGVGAGFLLPGDLLPSTTERGVFALFIGVAMCVSALPVIAKTLMDLKLVHRNIGQLILTVGMADDAIGWLLLAVVSAMATSGAHGGDLTLAVGGLVGVLVVAALIGRRVTGLILRPASRIEDPGPMTAICVVLILLASAGTQSMGLEAAFGAFVAGILISSTGLARPARISGLQTLVMSVFAPIFIASVGLRMDLGALGKPVVLFTAVVLLSVAIIGKFTGAYLGALMNGMSRWEATALGAGMNARGGVEVIVAMVGLRLGVLDTDLFTIIVLIAAVTSLMAPPILRLAMARVEFTAEEGLRGRTYGVPADKGQEMAA